MEAEGWYVDPYGQQKARWISHGTPTALVRDGGVESAEDPPPLTPPIKRRGPIVETTPTAGADLLRADSQEATPFDPEAQDEAAWDVAAGNSGDD